MTNSTRVTIGAMLVIGFISLLAWPYIKMEFSSSAHYTENDEREYKYYTPKLLKEMPRISDHYSFQYANISGPQAFVFGVKFEGIADSRKVRDYLLSSGYLRQNQCDIEAECWRSTDSADEVTISASTVTNTVSVQIYRSSYRN